MKINLIPEKNFDTNSIKTITKIVFMAENLLLKWGVAPAKAIEFYDSLDIFIKRISLQAQKYGLNKNQADEFIKASLNKGSYGTFDISKKTIIEMNFNPCCLFFYPSVHFIRLIIHESLHLFLYSRLDRNIYNYKFRFLNGKYTGKEKIIQLDEGFAEFLTEKILEDFDYNSIKELPIYSELNVCPKFEEIVNGLNIKMFNKKFDEIYNKNKRKGSLLVKKRFGGLQNMCRPKKVERLVRFIQEEIDKLFSDET